MEVLLEKVKSLVAIANHIFGSGKIATGKDSIFLILFINVKTN